MHGRATALSGLGRTEEAIQLLSELSEVLNAADGEDDADRSRQVNADLALARARHAAATGSTLTPNEVEQLRADITARIEDVRKGLSPTDEIRLMAEQRLAKFEEVVYEG